MQSQIIARQRSRAFTLIELLVVIAIIAILAAILFPVFAQAKEAAKKTQGVAHVKQLGTANMMYMTDYDDAFVLASNTEHGTNTHFIWMFLIYPYTKNLDIFRNPQGEPNGGATGDIFYQSFWKYVGGTYGSIPRAQMKGQQFYNVSDKNAIARALNAVGSLHNGVMGWGAPSGGIGCWGSCAYVSTPSLTQTQIERVAEQALIFDAGEPTADYSTGRPVDEELGTCAFRMSYSPGGDSIGGATPRWVGGVKSCTEIRGAAPGSRYDTPPEMARKILKGVANITFTDSHTSSMSLTRLYRTEPCNLAPTNKCMVHLSPTN
ncbi:MAG: prepilin-type N-terminal cleavage/methylation domain-containing protein [Verrucomicrobiaceae bacterium]|nr:MAG: prepilin-type N-terminal cleavage/methylation domain-containing protein [Verrucomicrobiaceae bacterium]